jgi:4-alpha-glucanotransferase
MMHRAFCLQPDHKPMTSASRATRRAGILVPLFSFPSSGSWGIGEIGDIEPMARWLRSAGQRLLQLLPISEMPPSESSPYSALSAMAIDPQFISIGILEDFEAIGGEQRLEGSLRSRLESVRSSPAVRYADVRELKQVILRRAFDYFKDREWASGTRRAAAFGAFIDDQAWWLEDYALFRALHAQQQERPWTEWPEGLRTRDAAALEAARADLAVEIQYRQYLQWVAGDQWADARDAAAGVALFGDLPFMVSGDSADVWARQDQFRMDASVGVPPDAFSATGQDWGLPAYRWDVMAEGHFEWLRARAKRNADLFDGYRIDHLVGFYRTYFRVNGEVEGQFTPATEAEQAELGERVIDVMRSAGAEVIAEDLGTVPDFVRESLARLEVPGYKVFRWERDWQHKRQPYHDPTTYPRRSVATSGTHDTEPLVIWWETAPREERKAVLAIPSVANRLSHEDRAAALRGPGLPHAAHEAILESLYASHSDLLILPVQDVFGWRDRVNQPATVSDANWTWRLPWPVERLPTEPRAIAVARQLAEWTRRTER